MSHFTHIKTRFQSLFYLEKALNKLNIVYQQKQKISNDLTLSNINLLIPQPNKYDIEFSWNSQAYELVVDMSFWEQSYPIQNFIDRIARQYATEVVIGESKKIGFQPIIYRQNSDGSNSLVLERWNSEK